MKRTASLIGLLAAMLSSSALASETYCHPSEVQKYHYGSKKIVRLEVGWDDREAFFDALRKHKFETGLRYAGGVGSHDPDPVPALDTKNIFLSSPSADVTIDVEMSNRWNFTEASISTFSDSCGPTEDWRPYWAEFRAYASDNHYRILMGHPGTTRWPR